MEINMNEVKEATFNGSPLTQIVLDGVTIWPNKSWHTIWEGSWTPGIGSSTQLLGRNYWNYRINTLNIPDKVSGAPIRVTYNNGQIYENPDNDSFTITKYFSSDNGIYRTAQSSAGVDNVKGSGRYQSYSYMDSSGLDRIAYNQATLTLNKIEQYY